MATDGKQFIEVPARLSDEGWQDFKRTVEDSIRQGTLDATTKLLRFPSQVARAYGISETTVRRYAKSSRARLSRLGDSDILFINRDEWERCFKRETAR